MRTFAPDFRSQHWEGEGGFFFLRKLFAESLMTLEKVLLYGSPFQGGLKTFSSLSFEERLPFLTQTNNRRLLLASLQHLTSSLITKSLSLFYFLKCCSLGDKKSFALAQEAIFVIPIPP